MEKKLFITYREGSYNPITRTYDPIDPVILQDPRVANSIIFDTNRRTIYAQGYEFGNGVTFSYMDSGTETRGYNVLLENTYHINGIVQDVDGSISYSYSWSYMKTKLDQGTVDNLAGAYITSAYINKNGELTYNFAGVHHTTRYGTVTATIYNLRNNVTNEILFDDPGKIMLSENNAFIQDLDNIIHVFDLTTCMEFAEIILDDGLLDKYSNILSINNNRYILYDNSNILSVYINNTGEVTIGRAVDEKGGLVGENINGITDIKYDLTDDSDIVKFAIYNDSVVQIWDYSIANNHFIKQEFVSVHPNKVKVANDVVCILDSTSVLHIKVGDYKTITIGSGENSVIKEDVQKESAKDGKDDLPDLKDGDLPIIVKETVKLVKDFDITDDGLYLAFRFTPTKQTDINERLRIGHFIDNDGRIQFEYFASVTVSNTNLTSMSFSKDTNLENTFHFLCDTSIKRTIAYGTLEIEEPAEEDPKGGDEGGETKGGDEGGETKDKIPVNVPFLLRTMSGVATGIISDNVFATLSSNTHTVSVYDFSGQCIQSDVLMNISELVIYDNSPTTRISAIHNFDYNILDYVNLDDPGNLTYHSVDATMDTGDYDGAVTLSNDRTINVVTGIQQTSNGKVTYNYTFLNTSHETVDGEYIESQMVGDEGINLLTNAYLDANGIFSYSYTNVRINQAAQAGTLSYLVGKETNPPHSYSVIWLYKDSEDSDKVTFTYSDLSNKATDGEKVSDITLDTTKHRVITNIVQSGDGKISYAYALLNTTHSSRGQQNNTHTLPSIINVELTANGEFTYEYVDLTTTSGTKSLNDQPANKPSATFLNNSSYRLLTNISQASDGKISYTFADFNTSHSQVDHTRTAVQSHVITNMHITPDGVLSYDHKALSQTGTPQGTYTINNGTDSPQFVYALIQNADGSITYKTNKIQTNITHSSDNVGGVVYEVNVDSNGQVISYAHKNLTTNSGTNKGTKKLYNDSSHKFITSVSQDAYGKLSYEYITLQNSFANKRHGDPEGVLTDVHIDGTGLLSYDIVDLKNKEGVEIPIDNVINRDAGSIIPDIVDSEGVNVITAIYQAHNGRVTYAYTNLSTDKRDYTYHDLKLILRSIFDFDASPGNVKVIGKLDIDHQGNDASHTISYTYTEVPTRQYVDGLIAANDAMHYCGTVIPNDTDTKNGMVRFNLTHDVPVTKNDTSIGAVYKVSSSGYFGEQYVTPGDMVISANDSNSLIGVDGNLATLSDHFDWWDVINNNVNLITVQGTDAKNGSNVITGINLYDDGTFAYNAFPLSVANAPTYAATGKTTQNSKSQNILLNQTNPKGFRVITDVNLFQNDLETKLSYTYTYLYVEQKHHGTNTYTATPNATLDTNYVYVVTGVSLNPDGTLSYCVTPYNVSDSSHAGSAIGLDEIVHSGAESGVLTNLYVDTNDDKKLTYVVTNLSTTSGSHTYNRTTNMTSGQDITLTNDYAYRFITNISQGANGKIAYDYAFLNTYHYSQGRNNFSCFAFGRTGDEYWYVGDDENYTDGHVIINVGLDANGKLSYTYLNLRNVLTDRTTWNSFHGAIGDNPDDIFYHAPINLTGTYFDIVSYVVQSNNGKITPITEKFYTYFWSNSTNDSGASKVIGSVYLGNNGNLQYSYVDIAKAAYHYAVATNKSTSSPEIKIPYNGTSSVDLVAYSLITNDAKGHITNSTKATYQLKHGEVTTSYSQDSKNITIPVNGTSTVNFLAYNQATTSNGHLTGLTKTTYAIKHGLVTTDTENASFDKAGTSVVASVEYTNGHLTKVNSTTITDENVKFEKYTSDKIYIGGSKQNTTTTSYEFIDGVAYINNGTLYETNIQVGTDLSVGGDVKIEKDVRIERDVRIGKNLYVNNSTYIKDDAIINGDTTIGSLATSVVTLNAAEVILPTSAIKIKFTNLQALWGTL